MKNRNENFSDYLDNLLQSDARRVEEQEIDDILDIIRDEENDKREQEDSQDELELEYIKPIRLKQGRGIKVELDKDNIDKEDIIDKTVKEDSPKIFEQDDLLYKVEELGSKALVGDKADLVINSSGVTLSEYFKHKRAKRGRNNLSNIVNAVKSGEVVDTENIYRKGYEEQLVKLKGLGKEQIRESIIKDDTSDFLRKYNKIGVYEKNILHFLGIDRKLLEELLSPDSNLSEKEKAKLLSVGYYSGKRSVNEGKNRKRKSYISFGDLDILYFIDIVKLASLNNLMYATGRTKSSIYQQLLKLQRMGITRCLQVFNSPGVWILTNLGRALIGSNRKTVKREQAGLGSLAERIYVNHVIACLYSGCLNILNLDDYPVYNRTNYVTGEKVKGEYIIPEMDMMSSYWSKLYEARGAVWVKDNYKGETSRIIKNIWETAWRDWENNGRKYDSSPEFEVGNEYLYMLMYDGIGQGYVLPDIVVRRDRNKDGSPNSIAIEVEKTIKTEEEYIRKLGMYKTDNRVFSKVIYITSDKMIAERIQKCAEQINFTRYDIVPMINKDGLVDINENKWSI